MVKSPSVLPADGACRDRTQWCAALQNRIYWWRPFLQGWGRWQSRAAQGWWWLVPFLGEGNAQGGYVQRQDWRIDTAPAFRDAFKSKCCLIPMTS